MRGLLLRLPLRPGEIRPVTINEEQPDAHVRGVIRRFGDDWLVSLFLVNGQQEPPETKDETWLFQTELEVHGPDGEPIFVKRALPVDSTDKDSAAYAEEASSRWPIATLSSSQAATASRSMPSHRRATRPGRCKS